MVRRRARFVGLAGRDVRDLFAELLVVADECEDILGD
jgi:hypothetical protein